MHGQVFRGIEGMRAWLAWFVTASHLILLFDLNSPFLDTALVHKLAYSAVIVFIMISGFVITNLLIDKSEPYRVYITRRFFRLYPVYFICLLLSVLQQIMIPLDYQTEPLDKGLNTHLFLHLTFLHGIVPDFVANGVQTSLLGPAWSLSLEWQFYLIAPFVIAGLRSEVCRYFVVLGFFLAMILYIEFAKPFYRITSFLPAMGIFFLIGIATRLLIEKIKPLSRFPLKTVAACGLITCSFPFLLPLTIWVVLCGYLALSNEATKKPGVIVRALTILLDSRLSRAAGKRSYAVYGLHWVVINLLLYIVPLTMPDLSMGEYFAITAVGSIVLTIIGAELLHQLVEKPWIRLGQRLRMLSPKPLIVSI